MPILIDNDDDFEDSFITEYINPYETIPNDLIEKYPDTERLVLKTVKISMIPDFKGLTELFILEGSTDLNGKPLSVHNFPNVLPKLQYFIYSEVKFYSIPYYPNCIYWFDNDMIDKHELDLTRRRLVMSLFYRGNIREKYLLKELMDDTWFDYGIEHVKKFGLMSFNCLKMCGFIKRDPNHPLFSTI
jgi:hypothetical protein